MITTTQTRINNKLEISSTLWVEMKGTVKRSQIRRRKKPKELKDLKKSSLEEGSTGLAVGGGWI